jgi:hypothetical protein
MLDRSRVRFLSVAYEDQLKFEQQLKGLKDQIESGRTRQKHNWLAMRSGTLSAKQYGVIGFPYIGITRQERNDMISHMVVKMEDGGKVFGTVVLAVDISEPRGRSAQLPYDALIFAPGHPEGATNFGRLVLGNLASNREQDFDVHLKSPRPRSRQGSSAKSPHRHPSRGIRAISWATAHPHPSENRSAAQTACIRSLFRLQTRLPRRSREIVIALWRFTAHRPFIPSSTSKITSDGTLRIVEEIGATVTVER